MKQFEKEIAQAQLNNEKAVLKQLEKNYEDALAEVNGKIAQLLGRDDATAQHVVYQLEYQKALKAQIEAILETLHANEFETISDYLTNAYTEGHVGALYSLQQQGVPFLFPLDQEQIIDAIQHETMLSESLYSALGKDTKALSKMIAGEISRGLSTGAMYAEIARNVASMARIPRNNAMRIARTEAHRIQNKAKMNVCENAKSKGADVVKQWDAALDRRTRPSHVAVDGEIRELDEKFSNGLMYPGAPGGRPEEVINCRCNMNQRARWALDRLEAKQLGNLEGMTDEQLEPLAKKLHMSPEELRTYQDQIVPVNAKDYDDFKKQYNKLWNYQGSDVQKRAEARIEGYQKGAKGVQRNTPKINNKKPLENVGKSSTIDLDDTLIHKSVGAKAKNYDVIDPKTGDVFHFAEGTKIQNSKVFAGNGTKTPLHEGVAEGLAEQLGGTPEKWQHCKGNGVLDYFGEARKAEVHWFQEETVGKVKFKVKEWYDEG